MNKNIVIIILLVGLVTGGIYWYSQNGDLNSNSNQNLVPPALPE